jgi:hypothetical protein
VHACNSAGRITQFVLTAAFTKRHAGLVMVIFSQGQSRNWLEKRVETMRIAKEKQRRKRRESELMLASRIRTETNKVSEGGKTPTPIRMECD